MVIFYTEILDQKFTKHAEWYRIIIEWYQLLRQPTTWHNQLFWGGGLNV